MRNSFKRIREGKRSQEPYQGTVLKFTGGTGGEMLGGYPNTCMNRKEFEFSHISLRIFALF